jgi:hypothetical protein
LRPPRPAVFRVPVERLALLLRLAAVRPVLPALRGAAFRVAPAFVVRVEEAGFAAREAADRPAPAPLALLLFREAAVPVFFMLVELVFLLLPVPLFAVAPLFWLPVFPDFTPRGMSLLLWHSCRSCRDATERKRIETRKRSLFFRNRSGWRPLWPCVIVTPTPEERSMNQQDKNRMGGQQGDAGKDDQSRRQGQQQQQQGNQGNRDRDNDLNRQPQQGQRDPSDRQRDQR